MDMLVREQIVALRSLAQRGETIPTLSEDEVIAVSSATRRVAFAYERLRNTLEPDEEHILRHNAIVRIVERRLEEDRSDTLTANLILQELIRAHYVPSLPKTAVTDVATIIQKTRTVVHSFAPEDRAYFLRFVAITIDRLFFPQAVEDSLVHLMYQDTYRRVVWAEESVPTADQPVQLYFACHKALFESSESLVLYHYFVHRFPFWQRTEMTADQAHELVADFPTFRVEMNRIVSHPIQPRLQRILVPASVPYRMLWHLLRFSDDSWASVEALEEATKQAITARTAHIQEKMYRRAYHSVMFLLVTKTGLTLPLELLYETFVLGTIHLLALLINTVFHPILLFFLSVTVRLPGHENTVRIIDQVRRIVTGEGDLPTIVITAPRSYGLITRWVFATVYASLLLAFFYLLFAGLHRLEFSIIATFFFVVFLGLTSFLAFRIRRSVREVQLVRRREGAISTIFTFLTLPMLEFGRWLATGISELNIIVFVMDLIIEAPFKLLIDVAEEWFVFIRERKEEIVE